MKEEQNYLMVTVSGQDRPGIAAAFTGILSEHHVEIVDIEQASPQDLLGLYFLLDISSATGEKDTVIKDLLFEASQLGLNLQFKLYRRNEVQISIQRSLFVITHFGGTGALAALTRILGDENVNIESITTLHHYGRRTMEMAVDVRAKENLTRIKKRLMNKSCELGFDMAIQKTEAYRKNKRLIVFDMDSTLVDMEIIDEIALQAGVKREVSRVTEKAMRGDLDFEEALRQRVAFLKGVSLSELEEIRRKMVLSKGVKELIKTLKFLGYKIGVVTGGFDFFSNHLKDKFGLDYAFANRLELKNDKLTGRVLGDVVDAAEKARIINHIAQKEKILLDQVVAVGDGANDALMLGQAGLGIAYNARKSLVKAANMSLGKERLSNILILLGITEQDVQEAHVIDSEIHEV
ncbi:MAG: phosphoserine phosphatase SerB [Thermodesulfobacteriota bacterium]|nr:phosphoserine phosphatase SerB [Thermodesulfobacteriota bacterium]